MTTPRHETEARRTQFGIRAARVHPRGRTDAIQLASDLTVWLFLTDDVYVEQSGMAKQPSITADHLFRSVRVLRDPCDPCAGSNPSLLALQDISRRLRDLATHEQRDRVINGMIEYFLAGCCEAAALSQRALPKAADYIPLRDAMNCLRSVCFVFIEIVSGHALPGPTWCRPDLQAVVSKAMRVIANHHDILSGLRELSEQVPMNLPAVIAREHGMSMGQAFAHVGALADADTHAFVELSARLVADEPDAAVRAYVDGLKAWIRGNLEWSMMTGRYRVPQYRGATPTACEIA